MPDEDLLKPNSQSSSSFQSFDCSDEALKYIAGYLAYKFRMKYPDLGLKTSQHPNFEVLECPWISALSRGGLTVPTSDFISKVYQMENCFLAIHKDNIQSNCHVIKTTAELIAKNVQILPFEILHAFVKTRLFIRIKFLNHQLKFRSVSAQQRSKAKLSHFQE